MSSRLISRNGREAIGDYLEFGVYAGTSMRCMFRALEALELKHVRLFGFDSFVGLPPDAATDDNGYWMPGMFRSDVERVRARLEHAGLTRERGTLIKGWFDDTLTPATREALGVRKASVLMMDADMYTSTKRALDFCVPLIEDDVVVFFDDWWPALAEKNLGERRALDEFLQEHPEFSAEQLDAYKPEARVFLLTRPRAKVSAEPPELTEASSGP